MTAHLRKNPVEVRYRRLQLLVVVFAALNVPIWHGVFATVEAERVKPIVMGAPETAPPGVPVRVAIPSIGVDAPTVEVALAANGAMDVPKQALDAGWYSLGVRPGENGSAVIAGHVDWLYGATGAFAKLHQVEPGDAITVEDDEGATTTFVVREIKTYAADADATDVFVSGDGKAHLNLITCSGSWDAQEKRYKERLVVFADRLTE